MWAFHDLPANALCVILRSLVSSSNLAIKKLMTWFFHISASRKDFLTIFSPKQVRIKFKKTSAPVWPDRTILNSQKCLKKAKKDQIWCLKKAHFRPKPEVGLRRPKTVIFELPESIEKPVCGDERGSGERIENWLL